MLGAAAGPTARFSQCWRRCWGPDAHLPSGSTASSSSCAFSAAAAKAAATRHADEGCNKVARKQEHIFTEKGPGHDAQMTGGAACILHCCCSQS